MNHVKNKSCRHFVAVNAVFAILALPTSVFAATPQTRMLPDATLEITGVSDFNEDEQRVLRFFERVCAATEDQTLLGHCATFDALGDEETIAALEEIVHNEIAAQANVVLQSLSTQIEQILSRIGRVASPSPVPIQTSESSVWGFTYGQLRPRGGGAGDELVKKLNVFASVYFDGGENDDADRDAAFEYDGFGFTGALDYRLSNESIIGGALTYGVSDVEFSNNSGEQEVSNWSLSAYGSRYFRDQYYVDWVVSYGFSDIEAERNLTLFDEQSTGETEGSQWGGAVSFGTDLNRGALLLSPYVRLQYINADIDSYEETSSNGLALSLDQQDIETLKSALGARVSKAMSMPWGVLSPSAHIEWLYEFQDDRRELDAFLLSHPGETLTIETDDPDRSYFKLGVAASAVFVGGRSAFAALETSVGQSDLDYYRLDLGFRMEL